MGQKGSFFNWNSIRLHGQDDLATTHGAVVVVINSTVTAKMLYCGSKRRPHSSAAAAACDFTISTK